MFLFKSSLWCIVFSLFSPACGLEFIEYDRDVVICPQAFSDCTIRNSLYEPKDNHVRFEASFKLCCKAKRDCALCLVLETEVSNIPMARDVENDNHSGNDEEDDNEDTTLERSSVTACYQDPASALPRCKKVEFTVNYTTLAHQNKSKIAMVITDKFHFGSLITVYPKMRLDAPSEENVCSQEFLQKHIPMCPVPKFRIKPVFKENDVELKIVGNKSRPSLCIKYEENGRCLSLAQTTIPIHSVAPCMCIQVWDKDDEGTMRSQLCPFNKKGLPAHLQDFMWKNVSLNVRLSKTGDRTVLLWNLTAPCRLDGELSLCRKPSSSESLAGVKNWKQNSLGLWEKRGAFENVDESISQCVMVKIKGTHQELGPFCTSDTSRWRWTLLIVGVMVVGCLTALMVHFLRDYVKKWVWSWRHGGFVKIGRKGHVVLLSPPDLDDAVSESVCLLGSQLCSQGFSVSVDQWCRKDQCTMGPLPWLYSQLQKLDSMGGRVVLVLTQKALEKTEEWTVLNNDGEGRDQRQMKSPYSDLFTASLFIIQAHKKLGRAAERFVLVKIDSHQTQSHSSDRRLPELLQGLPLFLLPAQSQSLTTELTVEEADTTRTGWRRNI
ncbi:interleukin-17 receptor C-like [Poecilia reticulata]|uniref:Interleukin-17 receptor C-like n=1 Tax=Poecilia reticulata TaxID=8081 RepID=A0A3P9NRX4_POERE|nr:PREDICTED: interleukin-17 receptor C-like [Poecilia reticulata]